MNQDVSPMDSDAAASPLAFRAASRAKSAMVRAERPPPFPAGFETHPVGRRRTRFTLSDGRLAHRPELGPPPPLPASQRRTPATMSSRPIFSDSSDSDVDLWDAPTREMFASEDLPSALRRGRASSRRLSSASGEYRPRGGMARARRRRDRDSSDATLDSDSDDPAYDSDLLNDLEKYRAALRADAFGARSPDQALRAATATASASAGRRAIRKNRATLSAPRPRADPTPRARVPSRAVSVTVDVRPRPRGALRAARDAAEAFAAVASERSPSGEGASDASGDDERVRRDAASSPRHSEDTETQYPDDETPTSARVPTGAVEWDEGVVEVNVDERRGSETDSGADAVAAADPSPSRSPTSSWELAPSLDTSATLRRRRSSTSGVDGSIVTGSSPESIAGRGTRTGSGADRWSRRERQATITFRAPPEGFGSNSAAGSTRRRKPRARRNSSGETADTARRESTPGAGTSAGTGSLRRGRRLPPRAHHSPLTFASDAAPLSFAFGDDAFASRVVEDGIRATRERERERGGRSDRDRDRDGDFSADPASPPASSRRAPRTRGDEDEPTAHLGDVAKALERLREEVRTASVAAARVSGATDASAGPSGEDRVSDRVSDRASDRVSSPGSRTVVTDDGAVSAAFAASVRSIERAMDLLSRSMSAFDRRETANAVAGDGRRGRLRDSRVASDAADRVAELEASNRELIETIETLRGERGDDDGEGVRALALAVDGALAYLHPFGGALIVSFVFLALAVAVIDILDIVDHRNIETVSRDEGPMGSFVRRGIVAWFPFTFGASDDSPELVPT